MFEQMCGSPMKGDPCVLCTTEPIPVGMGNQWEVWSLVGAPTAKLPLVHGIKWLMGHDPHIKWGPRVICFPNQCYQNPMWDISWGVSLPGVDLQEVNSLNIET